MARLRSEEMRQLNAELPVLVLTARQEVDTRVRCLDNGADDLMTKPFSLFELRARCRALLRRRREGQLTLRAGDLELSRLDHSVRRGGRSLNLTNKEFALLEHMMLNRGQCSSRAELLETVWNLESAQTTNIVDVYVNYLRRKLADLPPGVLIRTVRGKGYMIPLEIRAGCERHGEQRCNDCAAVRGSAGINERSDFHFREIQNGSYSGFGFIHSFPDTTTHSIGDKCRQLFP